MFSKKFLRNFTSDIAFIIGNAVVPAKALTYKKDENGNITDTAGPRTHGFENEIKAFLKSELKDQKIFPTGKNVFVIIEHGFHSEVDYHGHDLDNQAKTILDALKDVIYLDDNQVKILWSYKEFLKDQMESYCKVSIKIISKTNSTKLIGKMRLLQK